MTNLVREVCEARTSSFIAYVDEFADIIALPDRYQITTTSSGTREVVVSTNSPTFGFPRGEGFMNKKSYQPKERGSPSTYCRNTSSTQPRLVMWRFIRTQVAASEYAFELHRTNLDANENSWVSFQRLKRRGSWPQVLLCRPLHRVPPTAEELLHHLALPRRGKTMRNRGDNGRVSQSIDSDGQGTLEVCYTLALVVGRRACT